MASATGKPSATPTVLLKTKGLAMPPLTMQQSDGFQNPWHCLACDNWNSSRYTHCIKCASDRTAVDGSHTESSASRKKSSRGKSAGRETSSSGDDTVVDQEVAATPISDDSSEPSESTSSSQKTTTRVCEFFLRGKCKRRRNCPFLHCMPEDELKIRKARTVERAKALEMREQDFAVLEADLQRREEAVQQDSSRIVVQSNLLDSRRSELESARREVESMRSDLFDARRQHSALKLKYIAKENEVKQGEAFDGTDDIAWQYLRKGDWLNFDKESTRRLERAFRKLEVSPPPSLPSQSAASTSASPSIQPSKTKPKKLSTKPKSAGSTRRATVKNKTGAVSRTSKGVTSRSISAGAKSAKVSKPLAQATKIRKAPRTPAAGEEIVVVIKDRPHQCNVRTFVRYDPVAKSQSRIRRSNATRNFGSVTGTSRFKGSGEIFERLRLRNFYEVERFVQEAHVQESSNFEQVLKSCMLIQPRKMSYEFKPSKCGRNELLFHATSAENALKIQAGHFIPSNTGLLGQGIYFAPSPEKSAGYYRGGARTMLLCYVNLDDAQTRGTNAMVEYCIDSYKKCLPLYMLVF